MNVNVNKQRRELFSIRPLLYSIGFMPNDLMCSDKPDICIPSKDNRITGIEVVDYTHSSVNKNICSFNKLLQEYTDYFDHRKSHSTYYSQHSYRIKVWLCDGGYPNESDYRLAKERIFHELDNFLFPGEAFINNEYIASAEAEECGSLDKSIAEVMYIVQYQELDESLLLSFIKRKEKKLSDYKSFPENHTIKQYWLSICFPEHEQVEIRDYALPAGFNSEYDSIFLIKGGDCKQIWNKSVGDNLSNVLKDSKVVNNYRHQ